MQNEGDESPPANKKKVRIKRGNEPKNGRKRKKKKKTFTVVGARPTTERTPKKAKKKAKKNELKKMNQRERLESRHGRARRLLRAAKEQAISRSLRPQ